MHLELIWKKTKVKPAELDLKVPDLLFHLWAWFCELDSKRTAGFASLNPISFSELKAWSDLTGQKPTPTEVKILMKMDAVMVENHGRDS